MLGKLGEIVLGLLFLNIAYFINSSDPKKKELKGKEPFFHWPENALTSTDEK